MTDIQTLQQYENWKSAKRRRIFWINIIVFFLATIFAYISGNLLCKVGLTQTKKVFSYSWGTGDDGVKPENQSKLPKDYTEWYKKVKENVWVKKFGKKEDYFTKGEIAKRKIEKEKKDVGIKGGPLGDIADWWLSQGLTEEEAKKVDYHQMALSVYGITALFLILSWILFHVLYMLIFNLLFRFLIWKEPKLEA